jgi:hypothetical protein
MKTIKIISIAIIVISISSCGTTSNFANKRYLNLDKSHKSKDITPENTSEIKTIIEDEKIEMATVETTDLIVDQISSEAQIIPQNQHEQKAFQLPETNESEELMVVQEIETNASKLSMTTSENSVKLAPQKLKKSTAALRQAKGPKKPKSNSKQKSAGAVLAGVIIILGLFLIFIRIMMNLLGKAVDQAIDDTVNAFFPN